MTRFFLVLLFIEGLAAGVVAAQQRPSLAIESMTGADSFKFYCAPCHGRDGKGGGPVASALKSMPADLTTIAGRNGGRFPREQMIAYIAGSARPVAAHGSSDMPVWGATFRALDPSDVRVKVRIENLVDYLASIQAGR